MNYSIYILFFLDTRLFVTIAVDLVVTGVTEPVRFIVETKAKVYPSGEKFFWNPSRQKFREIYIMELKEVRILFFFQQLKFIFTPKSIQVKKTKESQESTVQQLTNYFNGYYMYLDRLKRLSLIIYLSRDQLTP